MDDDNSFIQVFLMTLSDDLSEKVENIFSQSVDDRDGRVVPYTDDVKLDSDSVKLDATLLYADLSQSSKLATDFYKKTAAKIIRSFLYCMSRLITEHDGVIVSFDGDRVMGVFIGKIKNTNAVKCGLKMNYVVQKIIKPKAENYFTSLEKNRYDVSHCVGIDTGTVLAVRAGQRGSNDLVWIGRAPNLAAKLSDIREGIYHTYISDDVFKMMHNSAKYSDESNKLMWEERIYNFLEEKILIHRSGWRWKV